MYKLTKIQEFSLTMFCQENIKKNYQNMVTWYDFKKKYLEFCQKHNFTPRTDEEIKLYIKKYYFVVECDKWFTKYGGRRGCIPAYKGLEFIKKQ